GAGGPPDDRHDLPHRFSLSVDGLGEAAPEGPVEIDRREPEVGERKILEKLLGGVDRDLSRANAIEELAKCGAIQSRSGGPVSRLLRCPRGWGPPNPPRGQGLPVLGRFLREVEVSS